MTTTTVSGLTGQIPQPIVRTLKKLIRRRRMVIFVRGLCAVLATAVGALLAAMAVDASVTIFAAWPRWALTGSAAALTCAAAWFFLVRPLVKSFSLSGIARAIESRHPELHERISSAVELLSSTESEEFRGSRHLIEALAREACQDVLTVAPRREVTLRSVKPFFLAAMAVVAVLGALMAIWPKSTQFLLARALAPHKNLANIQAADMTVTPGDVTIAAGQRLRVEVRVASSAVRKAEFRRARANAADAVEEMTPLVDSSGEKTTGFAFTLPAAESSFRYRVHAGDAVSRYYDVTVVPLPAVRTMDVIYDYPAYTKRSPDVLRQFDGDIKALAMTQVTILIQSDTPLASASLLVNGQNVSAGEINASGASGLCSFKMTLPPKLNGRWSARLVTSANGRDFESLTPEHRIESLADNPPSIKVAAPAQTTLKLRPKEKLPIRYVASDDIGLSSLEILTKIDGREQPPVKVGMPGDEPHRLAVDSTALDLSQMKLAGASSVTFQLRARDTLPGELKGPQEALSELFTITLDANSQPYDVQVTIAEEAVLRQLLLDLQKELTAAKQDSAPLKNALGRAADDYTLAVKARLEKGGSAADVDVPVFSDASSAQVKRIVTRLGNSEKLVAQLSEQVTGGTFAAMAEKVALVDNHVRSGSTLAPQVAIVEQPEQRKDKSDRTDNHIYQALRIVTEMLEQLHVMSELTQRAQQLEAMSEQQDDLAAAKAAMEEAAEAAANAASQPSASAPAGDTSAQPPMTASEWKQQENRLAAQLGQLAKKSPAAVAAEAKRDAEKIKDLASEARQQAKEQTQLAKESQRLAEAAELQKQIKQLAAEQTQLANEAKASKKAPDETAKMTEAAKDLTAGNLDKALPSQKDAQGGLETKGKADDEAARKAAEEKAKAEAEAKAKAKAEAEAKAKAEAEAKAKAEAEAKAKAEAQAKAKAEAEAKAKAEQEGTESAEKSPDKGVESASKEPDKTGASKEPEKTAGAKTEEEAPKPVALEKSQMTKLAERQADLTRRTAELNDKLKALEKDKARDLEALKVKQEQLAKEAGELSDKTKSVAPQDDESDTKAAMAAKQASEELNSEKTKEAAASAKEAAGKMEKLAEKLSKDAGKDAMAAAKGETEKEDKTAKGSTEALDPEASAKAKAKLAEKAEELASRQKDVAEQIDSLSKDNPTELAAGKQKELSDKSAELEKDIKMIQQHAEELIEDAATRQEAAKASTEITQAQGSQKTARSQLSAKNAAAAQQQQEKAAGALERTAAALEGLGKKLAEAAAKKPDGKPVAEEPSMDEAYDQTRQAAASEELSDAALASKMLGELAKEAAANAKAQGANPEASSETPSKEPNGMPSWATDPKNGVGMMKANLSPAELEKMGINLKDWARLSGHLKDEVLQAAEENVPEEYRQLVKQYFQEIARRGGEKK